MTNKLLKHLIEQHLEQIYPQIKNDRRGVLHKVIPLVISSLEIEEPQSKAEEICGYFDIKESSYIEDDFGVVYDNIGMFYIDIIRKWLENLKIPVLIPVLNFEKATFTKLCSSLNEEQKMEIIIVTAFLLISVFALGKWKSSTPSQHQKTLPKERSVIHPNQSVPTAICLAVPSSEVSGSNVGNLINRDDIIKLIDAASDFLCISKKDAEKLSIDIDMNQTPLPDSQLKFYIRIDIPDGQDIIGGETKYVIKRDLLSNIQGEIKELGRLKSISSISSFNRI